MLSEQQKDIQMIKTADNWPRWPFLPVKRYIKSGIQTGLIFATQQDYVERIRVFDVNLFDIPTKEGKIDSEIIREKKIGEYENAEALVNDGWQVD